MRRRSAAARTVVGRGARGRRSHDHAAAAELRKLDEVGRERTNRCLGGQQHHEVAHRLGAAQPLDVRLKRSLGTGRERCGQRRRQRRHRRRGRCHRRAGGEVQLQQRAGFGVASHFELAAASMKRKRQLRRLLAHQRVCSSQRRVACATQAQLADAHGAHGAGAAAKRTAQIDLRGRAEPFQSIARPICAAHHNRRLGLVELRGQRLAELVARKGRERSQHDHCVCKHG